MQRKQLSAEIRAHITAEFERVLNHRHLAYFNCAPPSNKERVIHLCAHLHENNVLVDDAIRFLTTFGDRIEVLDDVLRYPEVLAKLQHAYVGEIDETNRPLRDLLGGMQVVFNGQMFSEDTQRLLLSDVFSESNGAFCRYLMSLNHELGHYANHFATIELILEYYKRDFSYRELLNALKGMKQASVLTPDNLKRYIKLSYLGDVLTTRIKRDFMGFPDDVLPQERLNNAFADIKQRVDAQLETVQGAARFLEASPLPPELALLVLRYTNNSYKEVIDENAMLGSVQAIRGRKYGQTLFEYEISSELLVESSLSNKF